jgi:3D (Asp-Asp-Asp) domain-containing protein
MNLSSIRIYNILSLKLAKRLILGLVIIFVFDFFFFSLPVLAFSDNSAGSSGGDIILSQDSLNIGGNLINSENNNQPLKIEYLSVNTNFQDRSNNLLENTDKIANKLPESPDKTVSGHGWHKITAYNSDISQCDNSPCVTANGYNVCQHQIEDTIAANFLPFGAKVQIPDLFGDKVFIVRDRMSEKHANVIDIWMNDHQTALNFGVKLAKINVINEP